MQNFYVDIPKYIKFMCVYIKDPFFLYIFNTLLHDWQMESRLPKPKITLKRAISTMDINNKSNYKTTENNILQPTSSVTLRHANENGPPVKQQHLVRAKTLSTITRPNNTKAVKRTATTIVHHELKKPLIKPVAKALANRPNNNALVTNSAGNKTAQDDKTGKLKKWDLRGRLAQTSDKLSVVQQKNKDISSKYNALQELVDILKASETACKNKAKDLEESNKTLNDEFQTLTAEVSTMRKHQEDLTERLKESEESCANMSHTLKECQEKYKMQEVLLSEQTRELTVLKTDLELQKKINGDLNIDKEDLQILTHKMDKERRLLHNTIQELKGNIRVFCRVRPRTPKETEQMKA